MWDCWGKKGLKLSAILRWVLESEPETKTEIIIIIY
jgi:hypothetical protein